MNDTHRVTVPVEPEGVSPVYTAAYDSIRKGAPGLSDATCAVIARSINMKVSRLSAAPAPEGGAVKSMGQRAYENMRDNNDNASRAMNSNKSWAELSDEERRGWEEDAKERPHLYALATREEPPACKTCGGKGYTEHEGGEGEGYPSRPEIEACSCREEAPASRLIQTLNEASARVAENPDRAETIRANWTNGEEAPAEAGEIGAEYDAAAHCVTLAECPPGLFLWNGTLGFKSEYGAVEHVGISPHHQQWKVGNRADAYCADSGEYFWGGTSNHDDRAKLLVYPIAAETVAMVASHGPSALRSQPPAREDAQPVAWLVGEGGGTVMTRAAAWVAGKRDQGVSVTPLYTHPAPDALRVALEALEPFAKGGHHRTMPGLSPSYTVADFGDGVVVTVADFRRAAEAFAALQAEQKGGA